LNLTVVVILYIITIQFKKSLSEAKEFN
jgi:hypothetical protein